MKEEKKMRKNEEEKSEEEERRQEEDLIKHMLKLQADDVGVRKRKRYANANDFWEQPWGQLIYEPTVNNPMSRHGKIFRRRFRLPFPVFQFLVKLCNDHNIFQSIHKLYRLHFRIIQRYYW